MTDPTTKRLGRNLKTIRVFKGYTLKKFAKKLGINASYLCSIEKGVKNPSLELVSRIVKVTGFSYDVLLSVNLRLKLERGP